MYAVLMTPMPDTISVGEVPEIGYHRNRSWALLPRASPRFCSYPRPPVAVTTNGGLPGGYNMLAEAFANRHAAWSLVRDRPPWQKLRFREFRGPLAIRSAVLVHLIHPIGDLSADVGQLHEMSAVPFLNAGNLSVGVCRGSSDLLGAGVCIDLQGACNSEICLKSC